MEIKNADGSTTIPSEYLIYNVDTENLHNRGDYSSDIAKLNAVDWDSVAHKVGTIPPGFSFLYDADTVEVWHNQYLGTYLVVSETQW